MKAMPSLKDLLERPKRVVLRAAASYWWTSVRGHLLPAIALVVATVLVAYALGGNDAGEPELNTALYTAIGVAGLALVLLIWSLVAAPAELLRRAGLAIAKSEQEAREAREEVRRTFRTSPRLSPPNKTGGLRAAIQEVSRRKVLSQAVIDGRQLYGRRLTSDEDLAAWNRDVENWRARTAKAIEEELSPIDASDFLNTIGLVAADITGSFNRAHNEQRLALQRQLDNLDTLRSRIAA
jgi:hypothetical protein